VVSRALASSDLPAKPRPLVWTPQGKAKHGAFGPWTHRLKPVPPFTDKLLMTELQIQFLYCAPGAICANEGALGEVQEGGQLATESVSVRLLAKASGVGGPSIRNPAFGGLVQD
jgi:hypothetical protein